jgi:hypothetical protein
VALEQMQELFQRNMDWVRHALIKQLEQGRTSM